MKFNTKWGEIVARCIAAYPPGSPGLILALETLCGTAEREGESKGRSATAANACEGLHMGPPQGIKCLSCYHVEVGFKEEQNVIAEIAQANRRSDYEDNLPLIEGAEIVEE